MKLIQLSDDPWYSGLLTKINIIDPCKIIIPHTIYEAKPETTDGKLIKFIREEYPKLPIEKVVRRHFSETEGIDMIKKYCSEKYRYVKEEVATKYYALSAASALLKYLHHACYIIFKENSLKLEFETKFAHMQIGECFLKKNKFIRKKISIFFYLVFPHSYAIYRNFMRTFEPSSIP